MNKLRMLSLCSGIGGADLAVEWTGAIEIVGQVEVDPFCQRILEKHWPHVKRMGDIREVRGDEFGSIDLVVGGIPCQPFSSAGKQRGTDDDRYLWPDMFRIVQCALLGNAPAAHTPGEKMRYFALVTKAILDGLLEALEFWEERRRSQEHDDDEGERTYS